MRCMKRHQDDNTKMRKKMSKAARQSKEEAQQECVSRREGHCKPGSLSHIKRVL